VAVTKRTNFDRNRPDRRCASKADAPVDGGWWADGFHAPARRRGRVAGRVNFLLLGFAFGRRVVERSRGVVVIDLPVRYLTVELEDVEVVLAVRVVPPARTCRSGAPPLPRG
jgi:hypothetical protein